MLNINDLENRYKKYKLKAYAIYMTIFVLSTFALLLIYITTIYIYNSTQAEKVFVKHNETKTNNKKDLVLDTNISRNTTTIITENDNNITKNKDTNNTKEKVNKDLLESKVIFTPSTDFIKNIHLNLSKTNPIANQITNNKITLNTPTKKEEAIVNNTETNNSTKKIKEADVPQMQKQQTIKIENKTPEKITINKENSDIQDVIKRFNINKNPALSLFLAKRYYQLAEYENSYNYALTTNGIDSKIDESWIIFAKSLVKLNQRDKAIQTLEQYVSSSKSQNARIFLDDLKSGKFK